MKEEKNIKKIKITYEDGSEKTVDRGVVFSVYDTEDDMMKIACDGLAGTKYDEIAVLAIISKIAREIGIDPDIVSEEAFDE